MRDGHGFIVWLRGLVRGDGGMRCGEMADGDGGLC